MGGGHMLGRLGAGCGKGPVLIGGTDDRAAVDATSSARRRVGLFRAAKVIDSDFRACTAAKRLMSAPGLDRVPPLVTQLADPEQLTGLGVTIGRIAVLAGRHSRQGCQLAPAERWTQEGEFLTYGLVVLLGV
jgi:hypothetical protein